MQLRIWMDINHYYISTAADFLATESARSTRTAGGMVAPSWWQQMVWG